MDILMKILIWGENCEKWKLILTSNVDKICACIWPRFVIAGVAVSCYTFTSSISTSNASIFTMTTVVSFKSWMLTLIQWSLIANAGYVIKENASRSLSKVSTACWYGTNIRKSKLTTNNFGILIFPRIVTHRTPFAIIKQFHPAFVWAATTDCDW